MIISLGIAYFMNVRTQFFLILSLNSAYRGEDSRYAREQNVGTYTSNDTSDFRPLACEPETGKRTELNVPFRNNYPRRHWSASNKFDAFVQMLPTWLLDVWKQIFVKWHKK